MISDKKSVLVTGCTGLVGHGICSYLLKMGFQVIGTSRKKLKSLHENFLPLQLELSTFTQNRDFIKLMRESNYVIHNAAMITGDKKKEDDALFLDSNFNGTLGVINGLDNSSPPKPFVYISTTALANQAGPITENAAYDLKNPYYLSKACAELLVQEKTATKIINGKILRIRAPYGYRPTTESVVPKFLNLAKSSKDIALLGSGQREQIFTFVDDIARACVAALESDAVGIFNITGKDAVSMLELAKVIIGTVPGSTSKIVFSDGPDPQENSRPRISLDKASRHFGFEPVFDLPQGLQKIVSGDFLNFFETK